VAKHQRKYSSPFKAEVIQFALQASRPVGQRVGDSQFHPEHLGEYVDT